MVNSSKQFTNKNICPARIVIDLLKGKFAIEVLAEVINGSNHYGELRRNINGINPRILAMRLREFEHSGILTRTEIPLNPPQVIYELTDKGNALKKITNEMKKWHELYN